MSETATETTGTATDGASDADEGKAAADEAAKAAEGSADSGDGDWQAKFEAQQKINRDLDKKVKADKGARETAAAEKARADALQAKLDGKEAEHAKEQEKREAEQAALAKANDRILRSEVKAAAKGVLADPADAYKFLDLDSFEVSEDGEVDDTAITAALKDLVSKKPYLAVQDGKRFQGDADGGTRKESGVSQLSKADVEKLAAQGKHAEIEKARTEGRLNDLLGIK